MVKINKTPTVFTEIVSNFNFLTLRDSGNSTG